jgi:hypothetical protein
MGMSSAVTGLIPKSVSGRMMSAGSAMATGVIKAGARVGRGAASGSMADRIGNRGLIRAGGMMARHPMRTSAGAIGAAGGIAANRRRGSQNYPMY